MDKLDQGTQQALRDFYRFWETADEVLLARSTSKELKDHDRSPMFEGTDYSALSSMARYFTNGVSNMQHTFTQVHELGNNRVTVRWDVSGEHTAEIFGIAATGRKVAFSGQDILQLDNGKISELWHIEQLFQLTAQLQ